MSRLRRRAIGYAAVAVIAASIALAGIGRPAAAATGATGSLYVSAFGAGSVLQFPLDATGRPAGAGTPSTLSAPMSEAVVISPDGRHLYATDRYVPGAVEGFSVRADGSLARLPGSPYATGGQFPVGLAFSPDGRYLFATNYQAAIPYAGPLLAPLTGAGTVQAFAVAPDGALMAVAGGPVATQGFEPIAVVATPDGRHLLVAHNASSAIAEFDIAAGGRLVNYRPVPTGAPGADGLAVTPDGSTLFAVTANNTVLTYALRDGHATPSGVPMSTDGLVPIDLALTRDGRQLWVSNLVTSTVKGFAVGPGGHLTALTPRPVATGGLGAQAIAFSTDLHLMYVANRLSGSVSVLRLSDGGRTLTPVTGSPFFTGLNSPGYSGITLSPGLSPSAAFTVSQQGRAVTAVGLGRGIARYDWNFGDGTSATTSQASATHRYARAGDYSITLRVTGNSGCSADAGFTGITAGCVNASSARVIRSVTLA